MGALRYTPMMRALSIRQPYVEEIFRGLKTSEIRGHRTTIIGERFYIYAATKPGEGRGIAGRFARLGALTPNPSPKGRGAQLPTGLILGTARISHVTRRGDRYYWHLYDVKRLKRPRKPRNKPQPVWFYPF